MKQYKTIFVVTDGNRFWTKEFADDEPGTYMQKFKYSIDKVKEYPEITNAIIYSNQGTVISLTRKRLLEG